MTKPGSKFVALRKKVVCKTLNWKLNYYLIQVYLKSFTGFYHPRHNNAIPDSAPEAFVMSEQWEMSGRPLCHMWCLWLTFETGLWDRDSGWSKNNPGEMQFSFIHVNESTGL